MLIADVVVECGGDRRRGLGIRASQTDVDLDAFHAIDAERLHGARQQRHAGQQLMHHHRVEGVQLQLALGHSPVHSHVHAEDREAALVDAFGDHRVHFGRHDR